MESKGRKINMGLRNIRKEDDEILKKKSKEVEVIDDKIKELIKDMIDTMHEYDGVGLAAVQVGILKNIIVIDLYDEKPVLKLINPKITRTKGKQEVEEGCLSFPNKYVKVIRPEEVTVEAIDENGQNIKVTGTGLLAQAISHEMDHLNGVLLTDVMLPGTMEVVKPEKNERKK